MNITAAIAPTLFIRLRSEPVSSRICGHRRSEGASKSFSGMPYISCPMGFAINSGLLWGQKISVVVRLREGHNGISCFNQGLMSIELGKRDLTAGAMFSRSKHLTCALRLAVKVRLHWPPIIAQITMIISSLFLEKGGIMVRSVSKQNHLRLSAQ